MEENKKASTMAVLTAAIDLILGILSKQSGEHVADGLVGCRNNRELAADICLAVINRKINRGEVIRG